MTNIKLSRAWIERVTSEQGSDLLSSGIGLSPLPSDEEFTMILGKAASTNAAREMVRRKWFRTSAPDKRVVALQEFLFGPKAVKTSFATGTLFRRQSLQRDFVEELITLAWLRRVTNEAAGTSAPEFNAHKITPESIANLVQLSRVASGPVEALMYVRQLGIRVVIESSLPGMRADGVSFYLKGIGPVIGLTLRYDRIDNFWFTLLHEIGHVVLHLADGGSAVFVDSLEDNDEEFVQPEVEAEADAFAKDAFVPRDEWLRSEAFRLGTDSAIVALARKCAIHPAIIAGRLRFERKKYTAYSNLLGEGKVRDLLIRH